MSLNKNNQDFKKDKQAMDIKEVVLAINRVTKVVKGGKNFSFSVLLAVGDGKGNVGCGMGKAKEATEARTKAFQKAKKSMFRIPLREGRTLHHDIKGHFGASSVILRSAPAGTGIIAGGAVRAILHLIGVQDVVCKSLGSTNDHNIVKATFDALLNLSSPKSIAEKRGIKISEVIRNREVIEDKVN